MGLLLKGRFVVCRYSGELEEILDQPSAAKKLLPTLVRIHKIGPTQWQLMFSDDTEVTVRRLATHVDQEIMFLLTDFAASRIRRAVCSYHADPMSDGRYSISFRVSVQLLKRRPFWLLPVAWFAIRRFLHSRHRVLSQNLWVQLETKSVR